MKSSIPGFLRALVGLSQVALPGEIVSVGGAMSDEDPDLEIFIGCSDLDEDQGEQNAVDNGDQNWATTGRTRDEFYVVNCIAVVRNGDDDMAQAIDDAGTAIGAIELALRNDPTGACTAIGVLFTGVFISRVGLGYTNNGAIARVYFHVRVRARI